MRKYGMFIAVGLLVFVNAVVLAGIAYNRSGTPAAAITLTERELPLVSYDQYADRENTGLSLRLDWSKHLHVTAQAEWFDKAKLEAIGFDCSLPVNDTGAEDHYRKMLPRKTYAVLEYEGAAWEAWLADARKDLAETKMKAQKGSITPEGLENAHKEFNREFLTHSRLFVIDVANDPDSLKMQYSRRGLCMVLPAIVRLEYDRPYTGDNAKKELPRLVGEVAEILVSTIYVPKQHRTILEKLLRDSQQKYTEGYSSYHERKRGPSYDVKIHIGKRAEPWIDEVRKLPGVFIK